MGHDREHSDAARMHPIPRDPPAVASTSAFGWATACTCWACWAPQHPAAASRPGQACAEMMHVKMSRATMESRCSTATGEIEYAGERLKSVRGMNRRAPILIGTSLDRGQTMWYHLMQVLEMKPEGVWEGRVTRNGK